MKKHAFLFCFLLMIICGLVAGKPSETTSPTGVDGWWSGVPGFVSGELQVVRFTFNFKSDGDILTGAVKSGPTQPLIPIRDGKIEGDQITFWTEIDIGENKLRVDYKGDVKDYDTVLTCSTTITDPQGNSKENPMASFALLARFGTGNETIKEIEEIIKKKVADEKKAMPAPPVPADGPLAKPVDPIDAIIEAFRTHDVVALSEGPGHRNIPGHKFRLALIQDPRFPETVNDIVVECGNALYQKIMDHYIDGEEVPYDELSQVWMKTTQTHGVWNTPIYYEFFKAVRNLNKTLPTERRIRVLLGDPPVDRENQTDEEYNQLEMQRDSYPAGVIEREVIGKSRHALVIYGGGHFLRKNMYWALSDKKAAEKDYADSKEENIVTLLENKGIKVFSIWGSVNDYAQLIQPDVSTWKVPGFVYLKDNRIGMSPFGIFNPRMKRIMAYVDSEGKTHRENVGIDPIRSGLMQEQFDALMTYGPASSITYSK